VRVRLCVCVCLRVSVLVMCEYREQETTSQVSKIYMQKIDKIKKIDKIQEQETTCQGSRSTGMPIVVGLFCFYVWALFLLYKASFDTCVQTSEYQ
jgi:hypothetical protein